MVDDFPTYSLNYANCQHFVHDLAEKIIPEYLLAPGSRAATQPAFDKLMDKIELGEYDGPRDAFVREVADLTISSAKRGNQFFHFTKATIKSVVNGNWKPYCDHVRWLRSDGMRRQIAAYGREQQRLKLKSQSTGGSSGSSSTGSLGSAGSSRSALSSGRQ